MSEPTYFLWTLATAFGPVEQGYGDDKWRQIWKDRKVAQAWADYIQYAKFGQHRFIVPLPEYAERSRL